MCSSDLSYSTTTPYDLVTTTPSAQAPKPHSIRLPRLLGCPPSSFLWRLPAMASIESYVDHTVQVILQDGRIIVGKLKGYDPRTNLILSDSVEREFSMEQGVEMIPLGLYVIKGDNVAVVAELDEEKDSTINYNDIRAEPLAELRY